MSVSYQLACDQGATLQFRVNFLQATPSTTWTAGTDYDTNDVIAPVTPNGFVYNPIVPGESGSTEPIWPTVIGNTINDGSLDYVCSGPNVQAVDLTSYTAFMQVRTAAGATDLEASISTTSSSQGVIVLGGTNGSITATITGETTAGFTAVTYFYDLFVVGPTDIRTMVVSGKIKINPAVTVIS